jgi:hypothetical protein
VTERPTDWDALRSYVLTRDGGCCARLVNNSFWKRRWPMLQGLPDPGPCRNEFGGSINATSLLGLQLDHVKDDLMMGQKAPDDADHLWTVCPWHHVETNWATNAEVRAAARAYIKAANEAAAEFGWPKRPEGI